MVLSSRSILQQLNVVKNIAKNPVISTKLIDRFGSQARQYADVTITASPPPIVKENLSKAMKAYLERAQQHDEFMRIQNLEFKLGKRHLANIMGEDPETFTQEDVDKAIEYLFPSGLYDPKARPMMKPPEQIFPQRKAAEFDESGRPYHSMFYTGRPNFFKMLYDIAEHINELNKFEDQMILKQQKPDPSQKLDLSGTQWLKKEALEDLLVEKIADIEYTNFTNAFNRLIDMPYAYRSKDFIMKYRQSLMTQTNKYEIIKPQPDGTGRMFVTTYECLRKTARADVTIRHPGTGLIQINGQDITYFRDMQPREQVSCFFC